MHLEGLPLCCELLCQRLEAGPQAPCHLLRHSGTGGGGGNLAAAAGGG